MRSAVDPESGEIDYDLAVGLDAEDLAEQGILAAYTELAELMRGLGVEPAELAEDIDPCTGSYGVSFGARLYRISDGNTEPDQAWGLATYALFDIVNRQLSGTGVALYALDAGNDLFGIVLSPSEAQFASHALTRPEERPYLPTAEPDWFGMPHS